MLLLLCFCFAFLLEVSCFALCRRLGLMQWQLLRAIVPTAIVTYLGTADLQRTFIVTTVVLVVEIALFELQV